jgi:hypothetical protein
MMILAILALSTGRPAEPRHRRRASLDLARESEAGSRSPGRGPASAGRGCAADTRARNVQRREGVGRRARVRRRPARADLRVARRFFFRPAARARRIVSGNRRRRAAFSV